MKLAIFGCLGLIKCSHFAKFSSEPATAEAISSAEFIQTLQAFPAPSAPSISALIESSSMPITPPPQISFFGIGNWDIVAEHIEKPFFFVTNLELKLELSPTITDVVDLGFLFKHEHIRLIDTLSEPQLPLFIDKIKAEFFEAVTKPLQYCTALHMPSRLKMALSMRGVTALEVNFWNPSRLTKGEHECFYVHTHNQAHLKAFQNHYNDYKRAQAHLSKYQK